MGDIFKVIGDTLGALIVEEVRACLSSWRNLKNCAASRLVVRTWNLSSRVFRPL